MNDLTRSEAKARLGQLESRLNELQPLVNSQQNTAALAVLCDLREQLNALFFDLLCEHLSEGLAAQECAVDTAELRAMITSFLS